MTILLFVIGALFIWSCENSEIGDYSGGECDYSNIPAAFTVVEVSENGYTLSIAALKDSDKADFENSYTSKKISVEKPEGLDLEMGSTTEGIYTIMTHGSCNPNGSSVEIQEGVYVSVIGG